MNDFSTGRATSAKSEARTGMFQHHKIKWLNFMMVIVIHGLSIYFIITFPFIEHYKTTLWGIFWILSSAQGVTAGAHRLYSHRSFKATLPFQLFLILFFYATGIMNITKWVRIHRSHHKHSDTEADPHNSNRGFFFSHVGWIIVKRTTKVKEELKKIDMTDITENPLLRITEKYYLPISLLLQLFSIAIPVYYWNEDWYHSFAMQTIRIVYIITAMSGINSFAHAWGNKPYNKNIKAVESSIGNYLTFGEGYHNYHHTFPWDYRSPEFGNSHFDLTALVLKIAGKIGWAYDFKTVSNEVVAMTIINKGDNTFQEEAGKLALWFQQ